MAWEASGATGEVLSVSAAVASAKAKVGEIPTIRVTGEVTGFRGPNARSGHCYFQVKDDAAAMSVIVWRGVYEACGFALRDGQQIQMSGRFDVYEGSGKLSFIARGLTMAGEGLLRAQVAELARRLEAEGLMDSARKRRIPRFCTRVAVVTSLSGSVIDDVKRTLRRRNPLVELLCVGCQVQGPTAAPTIERALAVAASAVPDAILLVRGGGSFEDLMCFNDEGLARAVAACPVPVITGIGHEPDTCICDMVADRRTSTPTAAAESVAPALDEIVASIDDRATRLGRALSTRLASERQALEGSGALLGRAMSSDLQRRRQAVEALSQRRCLSTPRAFVDDRELSLELLSQRLVDAMPRTEASLRSSVEALAVRLADALPRSLAREASMLGQARDRLARAAARIVRPHEAAVASAAATLDALSPLKVLGRGYAIARNAEGHVVTSTRGLAVGDDVRVMVGGGSFGARVTDVEAATGA